MSDSSILMKPLAEVAAPKGFADTAIRMGFLTLQDIIDAGVPQLIKTEGFSYRWCHELFQVLKEHGVLGELEK